MSKDVPSAAGVRGPIQDPWGEGSGEGGGDLEDEGEQTGGGAGGRGRAKIGEAMGEVVADRGSRDTGDGAEGDRL